MQERIASAIPAEKTIADAIRSYRCELNAWHNRLTGTKKAAIKAAFLNNNATAYLKV
jgi:hypothetical protein